MKSIFKFFAGIVAVSQGGVTRRHHSVYNKGLIEINEGSLRDGVLYLQEFLRLNSMDGGHDSASQPYVDDAQKQLTDIAQYYWSRGNDLRQSPKQRANDLEVVLFSTDDFGVRNQAAYSLGKIYHKELHDFHEAEKFFRMVEESSDDEYYLFRRSQDYLRQQPLFSKISDEEKESYLGEIYLDLTGIGTTNYFKKADFEKKYTTHFNDAEPYWRRFNSHWKALRKNGRKEDYDLALAAVDEAIKENKDGYGEFAYHERAMIKAENREYEEAIDNFRKAPVGGTPEVVQLTALTYLSARRYEEALEKLNPLIQNLDEGKYKEYSSKGVYRDRGIIHAKLGNLEEALEDFSREIKIAPDLESLKWRGLVSRALGRDAEAEADFEKVKNFKEPSYGTKAIITAIALIMIGRGMNRKGEEGFRPNAQQEIEGFADMMLRIMLGFEVLPEEEKKSFLLLDPSKVGQLFKELIPLNEASRAAILDSVRLNEALIERNGNLDAEEREVVKTILSDALSCVTPLQQNKVGSDLAKRALPRGEGLNALLTQTSFVKVLKIFNERSALFLEKVTQQVHDEDSIKRMVNEFIEEALTVIDLKDEIVDEDEISLEEGKIEKSVRGSSRPLSAVRIIGELAKEK